MSMGIAAIAEGAIADQRRGGMAGGASAPPPRLLVAKADSKLTPQQG